MTMSSGAKAMNNRLKTIGMNFKEPDCDLFKTDIEIMGAESKLLEIDND